MSRQIAVGIDLGGTNIVTALVADDGEIIAIVSRRTNAARGAECVVGEMADTVNSLISDNSIALEDVVGLGIGTPGPLRLSKGYIHRPANLPGWENVPICQWLQEKTQLPVQLENDANAAAYAEYWVGAGKGSCDLVTLTLGTGIGAGAIIDGEILRGHFENAAEFGHTIVELDGRPCTCGQRGCLEQYASPGNIAKYAIEQIRKGSESSLGPVLKANGAFDSQAIAEAAQAGDSLADTIWDEACRYIALACVNVQHALNPEILVLAGGMSKAGDFLLGRVRQHFISRTWKIFEDKPRIVLSNLGSNAGVVGAAGVAWKAHRSGAACLNAATAE
ncbi:MAG: ROK family protein [Phycisphaerales bacterium]|nr:ROK family protein [Phycisphaerales bacterium]